jgi:hypothetical protein
MIDVAAPERGHSSAPAARTLAWVCMGHRDLRKVMTEFGGDD